MTTHNQTIKLNKDSRDFLWALFRGRDKRSKDDSRVNKKYNKFEEEMQQALGMRNVSIPDLGNAVINLFNTVFERVDLSHALIKELEKALQQYVYVIRWTPPDDRWWGCNAMYKIGKSKDPESRCDSIRTSYRNKLGIKYGEEGEFKVIASAKESAKLSEQFLHDKFSSRHISPRCGYEGGFFDHDLTGKYEWFDLCKGQDGIGDDEENKLLSYFPKPQPRDKKGRFHKYYTTTK